jgi:hypothetical protein
MTTLEDLRQRVRSQLLGFTRDQQQMSVLSDSMTPTSTLISLEATTARNISRGLIEIDDELILIQSLDNSTNVATILGGINGRGQAGSTAASHSLSALVTMSPMVPRVRITEAINQTLLAMYPQIPIFATTEISKLAPVFEYQMPADAENVWYIVSDTVGPTQVHYPSPRYRFNPKAPTDDFPSGKSIQLLDYVTPGRAIRVVYVKAPTSLSAATDDLTSTGYEDRMAEAVVWGACARLVPAFEAARLQQLAVEGTERANLVPAQAATKTAAYYEQLFQLAVLRERERILINVPSRAFWDGGG